MLPDLLPLLPACFTVYAARHATPDRSRTDIPYHIPPGPELTLLGKAQAAELGHFLRGTGAVQFYHSPLVRAWNTAAIASEICGVPLTLDNDLAEHRLDESQMQVTERMRRAFLQAARFSAENGPTVIVSHGSPVLQLLRLLGLPADVVERSRVYDSRNIIPMAGAWRIERDAAGLNMQLVFMPEVTMADVANAANAAPVAAAKPGQAAV